MKKYFLLIFSLLLLQALMAQTLLTEAEDFNVKTLDGVPIWLYPILDVEEQIVVIDFFSTTCGPCQDFADDFQRSYEAFGSNTGNVFHMGINWGNDNQGVYEFDSIFGLSFPSVSGTQGGGNIVYNQYGIQSYPTVIVINTAHEITNQYVWEPSEENIEEAILAAGGILVGTSEIIKNDLKIGFYPNPVRINGSISIELVKPAIVQFEVFNVIGTPILSGLHDFPNAGKHIIPLPTFQFVNGLYFIKLMVGGKSVKNISFVVDR